MSVFHFISESIHDLILISKQSYEFLVKFLIILEHLIIVDLNVLQLIWLLRLRQGSIVAKGLISVWTSDLNKNVLLNLLLRSIWDLVAHKHRISTLSYVINLISVEFTSNSFLLRFVSGFEIFIIKTNSMFLWIFKASKKYRIILTYLNS